LNKKKLDQAKLYKTQISLTEWFEKIGHSRTEELRLEDNLKRERLLVLNEVIGLRFDRSVQFKAEDILKRTPEFQKFLNEHGSELCALRLIPTDPKLPKLRLRGLTIDKVLKWFDEQKIDHKKYSGDFIPHGDNQLQSSIFVVTSSGIFGEIIKGGHYQLTQGFYDLGKPITFFYDFKNLKIDIDDITLKNYIEKLIKMIYVKDKKKQGVLLKKINAKFAENFLQGYFETVDTSEFGIWFVDYNRILGDLYNTNVIRQRRVQKHNGIIVSGQVASPGKVTGKVRIIKMDEIEKAKIAEDEILVCEMTTPDFVPLMKDALGIITDFGGILSHAAIISRELKKPCIVGTKTATKVLKDGDVIELDVDSGVVRKLN